MALLTQTLIKETSIIMRYIISDFASIVENYIEYQMLIISYTPCEYLLLAGKCIYS